MGLHKIEKRYSVKNYFIEFARKFNRNLIYKQINRVHIMYNRAPGQRPLDFLRAPYLGPGPRIQAKARIPDHGPLAKAPN